MMLSLIISMWLGSQPPEAIRQMLAARREMRGGALEYVLSGPIGDWHSGERHFIAKFAKNGDFIFEYRGDRDGWVDWEDGKPISKFPRIYLSNKEGQWDTCETAITANRYPPQSDKGEDAPFSFFGNPQSRITERWDGSVHEPRTFGIWPTDCSRREGLAIFSRLFGADDIEWSTTLVGTRCSVIARSPGGARMEWDIDTAAGHCPTRAAMYADDGRCIAECLSEIGHSGGKWFSTQCVYYADGKQVASFALAAADFEHESQYETFPTSAVIEPGTQVGDFTISPSPVLVWDGEATTTWLKWNAAVDAGRKKGGPNWDRFIHGGPSRYATKEGDLHRNHELVRVAANAPLEQSVGIWEEYVRAFIKRFRFDEDQSQKAWVVLRECQELALQKAILAQQRYLKQIEQLMGRADFTRMGQQSVLVARELTTRLNEIFVNELMPRLDRLPTRDQRKNPDPSVTLPTQPAGV